MYTMEVIIASHIGGANGLWLCYMSVREATQKEIESHMKELEELKREITLKEEDKK